ncbi:hypothetical protein D3C85_891980 [compost metagenome]
MHFLTFATGIQLNYLWINSRLYIGGELIQSTISLGCNAAPSVDYRAEENIEQDVITMLGHGRCEIAPGVPSGKAEHAAKALFVPTPLQTHYGKGGPVDQQVAAEGEQGYAQQQGGIHAQLVVGLVGQEQYRHQFEQNVHHTHQGEQAHALVGHQHCGQGYAHYADGKGDD